MIFLSTSLLDKKAGNIQYPLLDNFIYLFMAVWVSITSQAFAWLWAGATLHCSAWTPHCSGFSHCGAQALGCGLQLYLVGSEVVAPRLWVEHRLSSCGTWAYSLHGMWDLPGSGIEPVSPSLAGRFFTIQPPGEPHIVSTFLSMSWEVLERSH